MRHSRPTTARTVPTHPLPIARARSDLVIWIRHDDVVKFQKKVMDDCKTDAAAAGTSDANCEVDARQDKTSKVCELVLYQSLTHTQTEAGEPGVTITDGAGQVVPWRTHTEKEANGHDEDGHENGYSAQDPDGNLVHYSSSAPVNLVNAIPKCARRPARASLPFWS